MGFLSCLQTINLYNIHIGQYTNKEDNLLGPPMVDPTPVSHTLVIISGMIFLKISIYAQ